MKLEFDDLIKDQNDYKLNTDFEKENLFNNQQSGSENSENSENISDYANMASSYFSDNCETSIANDISIHDNQRSSQINTPDCEMESKAEIKIDCKKSKESVDLKQTVNESLSLALNSMSVQLSDRNFPANQKLSLSEKEDLKPMSILKSKAG